ncbi:MAG: calcium-binding protein [Planctomycetota bacterium]
MSKFTSSVVALMCGAVVAQAEVTWRVSVNSYGEEGNYASGFSKLSGDGRFVTYASGSYNLVPDDTNGAVDIFLYDVVKRMVRRVSVASGGGQANAGSESPAVSDNGRWVAFLSSATNLVPGDTNGFIDAFVHDTFFGSTERVSVASDGTEANAPSWAPAISGDGRFVAFTSSTTNLVPGDTNAAMDVFLHDRKSGETTRVSVSSSGAQGDASSLESSLSRAGRYVAFASVATNLVEGDSNNSQDIFVRDVVQATTVRVSLTAEGGQSDDHSVRAAISTDGAVVAFVTEARLVPEDDNDIADIYVRDLAWETTERVSVSSQGREADRSSDWPDLSADGRFVAFSSIAKTLVRGDLNGFEDVFVHDRTTRLTRRVSLSWEDGEANYISWSPAISGDGRVFAFSSGADNLVPLDTNGWDDVFLRDATCPDPTWSNYGDGWPGTYGVPALISADPPQLCHFISLALGNSRGEPTAALLLLGMEEASVPTPWGGTVLVLPRLAIPLPVPAYGLVERLRLSCSRALCAERVRMQVLEMDPGAQGGVSFSAGLELVPGD